jgi:dTDP-4-dehydrorhamnose reductase
MRLLIAGWHGQLARALVEAAPAELDIDAMAVGRPGLDLIKPGTIHASLAAARPDVIINSAAYTAVDKAESEPDAAFALNRDGAGLLAEAAARRGAAIIHVSTDYVFDGSKPGAWREDDLTGPLNVYGRSKLAGEQAVRAANPRHVILRTSWVHGPHGTNFVRTMLRLARERPELRVVDDQTGSPTYAPHLAAAILAVARAVVARGAEAPFGTYHLAGSGATTWCGLAREAMAVSARLGGPSVPVHAITTADYPTPAERPRSSVLDCARIAEAFSVSLPDWQAGVADGVARLIAIRS